MISTIYIILFLYALSIGVNCWLHTRPKPVYYPCGGFIPFPEDCTPQNAHIDRINQQLEKIRPGFRLIHGKWANDVSLTYYQPSAIDPEERELRNKIGLPFPSSQPYERILMTVLDASYTLNGQIHSMVSIEQLEDQAQIIVKELLEKGERRWRVEGVMNRMVQFHEGNIFAFIYPTFPRLARVKVEEAGPMELWHTPIKHRPEPTNILGE